MNLYFLCCLFTLPMSTPSAYASWGLYDQGTNNYHHGFQSPHPMKAHIHE
ncbi:MAG: hypothetical protein ABSH34_03000 [Verrucomicrobiota bacterium]|jgi:hypothetical protein